MPGLLTRRSLLSLALTAPLLPLTSAPASAAPKVTAKEAAKIKALVDGFLTETGVSGMSACFARNGEIVLSEGFGVADREANEPVKPDHLFRIASVSKPITSIAVFALIEAGKLKLTDKVFGDGAILGDRYGLGPNPDRLRKVTVDHLLTHTSGGWPNDNGDPMFNVHPDYAAEGVIEQTIASTAPANEPGSAYAYSNFGYCVLGRVIEQVSGRRYADFVRDSILEPCGAEGMRIAGNTLAARLPGEVRYYDRDWSPYDMNVARMDAHGGWAATAPDLVSILLRVDRFKSVKDILKPASLKTMTTAPKITNGYARGWGVNSAGNCWHNGSLPGTSAIFVRTSGGFCWAGLCNGRNPSVDTDLMLDELMWKIAETPRSWR